MSSVADPSKGVSRSTWQPRLLALDIDGTVVAPDCPPTSAVVSALETVIRAGAEVVLATGRSIDETWSVLERIALPDGHIICSNGAVTGRIRGALFELEESSKFDARYAASVLHAAIPRGLLAVEVPGRGFHVTGPFPDGELLADQHIVDWPDLRLESVTRIIFRDVAGTVDEFLDLANLLRRHDLDVSVGYKAWLDVGPRGVSKGTALEQLCMQFNIPARDVLAVGDGRNDMEMLVWAGRGVAMGNAPLAVQSVADDVTESVLHDGLAVELARWF